MTDQSTASADGARAHARGQAAAATLARPDLPADVDPAKITWSQRIPSGGYANVVLGRGTRVRLGDPAGAACAHLLLLRADAPWERLNVADTVKVPWQAYLSSGHPLLSDQGRVLATVLADTSARHDTLCGPSEPARALLRLAGSKQGLQPRDLAPSVSFFRGVRVAADGALVPTGGTGPGATVDLLVHLPVVLLVANAVHPLDARTTTDLDIVAWSAPADLATAGAGAGPEYQRAVQNTEAAWTAARNKEALV
ncbi:DUF1989 domain-containing protein [Nocardia arizonensis]|uniref:DUF1989 domain-containing protein n=1 Tax=Nocardia arizonensis TaxID=1141647 RepID=UPI0006D0C411|nr:DUF1989 domain-containing protein [Nocardia arizonensis]